MNPIEDRVEVVQLDHIRIPYEAVLKRLGSPAGKSKKNLEMERIYNNQIENADTLMEPRGVYRLFNDSSRESDLIRFQNHSFVIQSRQVQKMLRHSDPVCFFMVTIGSRLEEEAKRLSREGEMACGVVLDAIGSETADAVADHLHRIILKDLAGGKGYSITPRFSPGYGDWPVTVQGELLEVCKGERIGISVNASSFMIPRKSVSAVLGWEKK
jgi:cobalamin-dependent methionine synthase I